MHHVSPTNTVVTRNAVLPIVAAVLGAAVTLLSVACSSSGTPSATPSTTLPTDTSSSAVPNPEDATATDCAPGTAFDEDLRVDSTVYGTSERVRVHITPCAGEADAPLPILYLLHGANADETQWIAIGGLDEADSRVSDGTFPPSIIVIPDAAPAYACSDCSGPLTAHLLDEVEPLVNAIHPVNEARRAIGGISRGGGLALEVAGFDVSEFVAVGGHSAVSADPDAIANLAEAKIPVWLDAGNEDGLVAAAREMTTRLRAAGGDVALVLGEGGHNRPYWSTNLPDYFGFYGKYLGAE